MRHLQLKRSDIIYDNEKQALEALKTQATATYRDTASTSARVMRDGEPILASYRDAKAPGGVADILALLIKKNDGTDALFYIDSQDILNKIGITIDGDINPLWVQPVDDSGKTPIVIKEDDTTTVIDAINDLANYIIEAGKSSDKSFKDLQKELDKTQELIVGFNSNADTTAPFSALTKAEITSGATSLMDAVKKIDDTVVENERITSASLNDLDTRVKDLSAKTITELDDTNTIDFNVTTAKDGTLKADGSVKVSSDVDGNLLKVSGNTGLYVSTKDIQGVAGAVDEITKTTDPTKFATSANTFTVSYANGKEPAIHQITYDSAMPNDLTTPSQHGGIKKGTTAQSLNGMSVSKILDMILFPEIFPTLNAHSVGLNQGGGSYEVGTTFPTFTVSTNRGLVTCPGQTDKYQLGNVTKTAPYTGDSHTTAAETLPATVSYGTINVHGYAEFAQGDTLTTSYGKTATKDVNGNTISQNPHPATALTGGSSSVRGFYKYGGNMTSIDTIAKANEEAASNKGNNVVKNGATVYDKALIVDYKSKEAVKIGGVVDGNGGFVLALPKAIGVTSMEKIKDILQFNAGSGSWDASVKADWEVFTPSSNDATKFPGTLNDAAGNTYPVTYFKHKEGAVALDGSGAARVSFAFVW